MHKNLSFGLSALAAAALLSGCAVGGGSSTTPAPTPSTAASVPASAPASGPATTAAATSAAAASAKLMTADSALGPIVVDGNGMSIYYFTKDTKDSGTSACTDACLAAWPPVTATEETPAVDGVTGTPGTITTPDGKKQVTINGMPVYYFAKDKAAGDILGQGVNSVWYLVAPSGDMVTSAAGKY